MLETLRMVDTNPIYVEVDCGGQTPVGPPTPVISDAILKPRILFSNGFETLGQLYRFGNLDKQGFFNGVYVGLYGNGADLASNCARGIMDWHQTGGRENGGYITTRKNTRTDSLLFANQHEGSYICYSMPVNLPTTPPTPGRPITARSLGHVCGFNLFGSAPAQKIAVMGLGITAASGQGTQVPFFQASMYLTIDTDLTIGCHIGDFLDPFPYDVTLGIKAPVNGWFALDLQGHNQVTDNNTSGFVLAQLYTLNDSDANGAACIRSIGVPTNNVPFSAFASGSDVAMQNGGIDNLGIDDWLLYDSTGSIKRFFGSIYIGAAQPSGPGDLTNSIISFDSTHTIEDSAHVPVTAGFPVLHGDSARWKNAAGLLNIRDQSEKVSLSPVNDASNVDITYGVFSANTGQWIFGPFSPGLTSDGGPYVPATMENNIVRNTIHDENADLYQTTIDRFGIVLIEGIQPTRRTGVRRVIGGVLQQGVSGAYTDLFSAVDDFAEVIPPDTYTFEAFTADANMTVRRHARFLLKDLNGIWAGPIFVANSDGPVVTGVSAQGIDGERGGGPTDFWMTNSSFCFQPARSFLDIHPILNVPYAQLAPTIINNNQVGIRGDFTFYDAAGTLSLASNHRWIRFEVCELGFDFVYRKAIPNFVERDKFPPIACLTIFTPINSSTRAISVIDRSDDWDGTIVSVIVNWGDGIQQSITPDGGIITHTYSAPGIYTITEIVTDNDGLVDQFIITPINAYIAALANFTATNPSGNELDFTDTSVANDETISGWHWDFGDGNTSILQNPTHTYAAPGTYNVVLTLITDISAPDAISFSSSFDVPFVVVSGCTCSAPFMANTAKVQGDDFAGNNPPLPAYADLAAFNTIYQAGGPPAPGRYAYDISLSVVNDGIEYDIDSVITFNGHNTLKMQIGKPASTEYDGAGWITVVSDDADPVEGNISESKYWARVRFKAAAGIMNGQFFQLIGLTPATGLYEYYTLSGSLWVETHTTAGNVATSLGSDSQVLGTAGFIDMLVYYDGATVAGHARVALWIADACDLSGKSPIDDRSVVNAGSNLLTTVSSSGYSFFETGVVTGPLKQLNVADWETLPASVSANPFSVSGV